MMAGYYQIGGYGGHVQPSPRWHANDPLCADIAGPRSALRVSPHEYVELILGIHPNGASYLLMNHDQLWALGSRYYSRYGKRMRFPAENYIALSPIHFRNEEELKKKLAKLQPRYRKGSPEQDNSQANGYYLELENKDNIGTRRGIFEQQRVLYRLIQNNIDISKFSLKDPSWLAQFKIVSLYANTWSRDVRERYERERTPRILDVGWYEAELLKPLERKATRHFDVYENRSLRNGRTVQRKKIEGSEILPLTELKDQLRELTNNLENTIILVYGEEQISNILKFFDIRYSQWRKDGMRSLLWPDVPITRVHQPRQPNLRDPRFRQRSLSPGPSRSSPGSRPRSPLPSTTKSTSVYVVDVKDLCRLLSLTSSSLTENAQRLGVDVNPNEMCAADDAQLLVRMWMTIASGPSIDEQADLRGQSKGIQLGAQPARVPADEDVDPNDIDPNDIVQEPGSSSSDLVGPNDIRVYEHLMDDEDFEED